MSDDKKISEAAKPQKPQAKSDSAYDNSIAALRLLISGAVDVKVIPPRGDRKEPIEIYEQRALLIGGSLDLQLTVSSRMRDQVYDEGVYMLPRDIFEANQYGGLGMRKYMDERHVFVKEMTPEQKALFEQRKTDIGDLA